MTPRSTHPTTPLAPDAAVAPLRVLITAGPTHEPIDRVRYIGNRSSGRIGASLAHEAVQRGHDATLLLGPAPVEPSDSRVKVVRFRTAADLQALLRTHGPNADLIIMAAAVADYRPKPNPATGLPHDGKFRRTDQKMILELEPTPDLLAEVAHSRRPGQFLVGFALEPREEMIASATQKLERKAIDLVVANPLETMDSPTIEATLLTRRGVLLATKGPIPKPEFARWLFDAIAPRLAEITRA